MTRQITLKLNDENIQNKLIFEFPEQTLLVDRKKVTTQPSYNFYGLARLFPTMKETIKQLSDSGFYLVEHKDNVSRFEKINDRGNFKPYFKNSELKQFENFYYHYQEPVMNYGNLKLLVIFSSVADLPYNANIARRNFFSNFESIQKYIPDNTAILRITDIGGVVGSFYLNNNFDQKIEQNLPKLIASVIKEKNIKKRDVVLYGASKGGTAALYYGIAAKYHAIAVDPVVTDEFHEQEYNDIHFTKGLYPETKQDKFQQLMQNCSIESQINIIYSEQSPLFPYINDIIRHNDNKQQISYFNIVHPSIKSHPDVGPNSINTLLMLMNQLFYKEGNIASQRIL